MGKTPKSVLVVSILGIIYAAFSILMLPCGIYVNLHPLAPNPVTDAFSKDEGYVRMMLITGAIGLILGVLLLASSIGSLKLKRWARFGMNAYAVLQILQTLFGMVFTFIYVLPATAKALESAESVRTAGLIGGIVGGAISFLLVLAIATIILVVFNRKVAVDAFNGIFPAEGSGFPVEDQPTGGVV